MKTRNVIQYTAQLLTTLAVALSVGCASGGYTVQYPTTKKADVWKGQPVAGVLRVMPLVDQTTPVTNMTVEVPPDTYRLNCRGSYKDKEIANGVTEMIINHLKMSGLFKDVVGQNSPKAADLELCGAIGDYSARARVNKGAETSYNIGFGISLVFIPIGPILANLIMNAAMSGDKSDVQAAVTLRDMTLKTAGTTNVLWQNTINVNTNYAGVWATALNVYPLPDNCLRTGVNDMIQQIGTSLQQEKSKEPVR